MGGLFAPKPATPAATTPAPSGFLGGLFGPSNPSTDVMGIPETVLMLGAAAALGFALFHKG